MEHQQIHAANAAVRAAILRLAPGGVGHDKTILRELPERRSSNAKTFLNADGTHTTIVHGKPLHYREAGRGPWLDIDTTWRPSDRPGFAWEMTTAPYKAWIAGRLGASPFALVEFEGQTLRFRLGDVMRRRERGPAEVVMPLPDLQLPKPAARRFSLQLPQGLRAQIVADNHRLAIVVSSPQPQAADEWLEIPLLPLSLTAQATDVYAESADGYIRGGNADYPIARATSAFCNTEDSFITVGQIEAVDVDWYGVFRGYLSLPTGPALEDDAFVTAAVLYVTVHQDLSDTDFNLLAYHHDPEDGWQEPLCDEQEDNYDKAYDINAVYEGVVFNTAGIAVDTYYIVVVGAARINKDGDTKYCLVSEEDVNASAPDADTDERVKIHSSEEPGTDLDPYLAITWHLEGLVPADWALGELGYRKRLSACDCSLEEGTIQITRECVTADATLHRKLIATKRTFRFSYSWLPGKSAQVADAGMGRDDLLALYNTYGASLAPALSLHRPSDAGFEDVSVLFVPQSWQEQLLYTDGNRRAWKLSFALQEL